MSHLLNYLSNDISFVPLYGGQATLKDDIKSCESRLEKLSLPFDAVYLGMGPDGHFASLFPGDETLDNSNSLCVAVEGTNSRLARISLTASAILNARKIYLLFSGEDKLSIYRKARIPGSHYEIPIRFVLSQNEVPVMVYYT
jgi:6-phosphogluconolactonase